MSTAPQIHAPSGRKKKELTQTIHYIPQSYASATLAHERTFFN